MQDPERLCKSLLVGKVDRSPFSSEAIMSLRESWVKLLGGADDPSCLECPPAQPFFLKALARTAELLEDPDWEIIGSVKDCYITGVPVGFEHEIPHVPHKQKWRKLDVTELELDRSNYSSADLSSEQLLAKFRDEERLGRMEPSTMGALKQEYPVNKIRVASMGAISKPDGAVRPLHDGTHGSLSIITSAW